VPVTGLGVSPDHHGLLAGRSHLSNPGVSSVVAVATTVDERSPLFHSAGDLPGAGQADTVACVEPARSHCRDRTPPPALAGVCRSVGGGLQRMAVSTRPSELQRFVVWSV
jgi:hypothetical protein